MKKSVYLMTLLPFLFSVLFTAVVLAENPTSTSSGQITYPVTRTEKNGDGSTSTTVTQSDGSYSVTTTGGKTNTVKRSINFDSKGHVVSENATHVDPKTGVTIKDETNFDPKTGVRTSTSTRSNGGVTKMVSKKDGSSTITSTGFNENTVVTTEDAEGHVSETTSRPDGTKTVRTFTRLPERGPDAYGPDNRPSTETKTEYNAEGKPTKSVTTTDEPWGRGYRQTRREVTRYDGDGKPTGTTVTAPDGKYGQTIKVEEIRYHYNGYRKIIQRFDADGQVTETYYYDELGKFKRKSIRPGHTAGAMPTNGTWYVSPKEKRKKEAEKKAKREKKEREAKAASNNDQFGDNIERSVDQDAFNAPDIGYFFKQGDDRPFDSRAIDALGNFNPGTQVDEHYSE